MPHVPPNKICDACVFDASRWTREDAIRTIEHAGDLVALAIDGLADDDWTRRTRPDVWSIAEYVDHMREVIEFVRLGCELGQATPDAATPDVDQPVIDITPATDDRGRTIEALRDQAATATSFFNGLRGDAWDRGLLVGDARWTAAYSLTHICHDLMHHLADIAGIRRYLGDTVGPLAGVVAQINAGGGGVPKLAKSAAVVGPAGVEGDRQATRRHHGRPWQALCLYSADVIDALAAEGHPITPGAVGENLTLSGVDWSELRAGLIVTLGEVRLRLSAPAAPCTKTSGSFVDRDHMRMAHERHPGWSRWYASVLQSGTIMPGDIVVITT